MLPLVATNHSIVRDDSSRTDPTDKNRSWSQFRGDRRDGVVDWLPKSLPPAPVVLWETPLNGEGIGGIAATESLIVVSGRDVADEQDVWHGISPLDGSPLWQWTYPAAGELDYGNSPRATPLITDQMVICLGAMGDLHALDRNIGISLWQKSLTTAYSASKPDWGFSGSPLRINNKIIIQPGGPDASLVALNELTGDTIWKTPGAAAAYVSAILLPTKPAGIVGLTQRGITVWDAETGQQRQQFQPEFDGDFGVPSPVEVKNGMILTSENNGTRLYRFSTASNPTAFLPKPIATNEEAMPDSHTPVAVGDRLFVVYEGLRCLEIGNNLKQRWILQDSEFQQYCSIIASKDRLLITTESSQVLLVDISQPDRGEIIRRWKLGDGRSNILSHPAILHDKLLIRVGTTLQCIQLGTP